MGAACLPSSWLIPRPLAILKQDLLEALQDKWPLSFTDLRKLYVFNTAHKKHLLMQHIVNLWNSLLQEVVQTGGRAGFNKGLKSRMRDSLLAVK